MVRGHAMLVPGGPGDEGLEGVPKGPPSSLSPWPAP